MSLDGLSEKPIAVQSPEDMLIDALDQQERQELRCLLVEGLDSCLTQSQRRRLWLHCVDGLTVRQIAKVEGVRHPSIIESLAAAKRKMSIYITGDCHGDFDRFATKKFPQLKEMDRDDYMIICGDHGGVWAGEQADRHKLDWLEDKPFTTLFVDGNHENFDLLNAYPEQQWHGGRVHVVRPHVLHLMRGQIFDIGGRTFFTMGGAASHDIEDGILDPNALDFRAQYIHLLLEGRRRFRIIGKSWWPKELPSDEEYAAARDTLERAGWKVDYVITHCAPTSIAQRMDRHYQPDRLTDFLETVLRRCQFGKWFCGHYHINQVIDEQFVIQWEQISQID